MTPAVIAMHEKDDEAMTKIQEDYLEDAENFWKEMSTAQVDAATVDDSGDDDDREDRTKPPQRGKVWQWVVITWHMMFAILGVGWQWFMQDSDPALRDEDPLQWPSITVSLDQGSDGWSACAIVPN